MVTAGANQAFTNIVLTLLDPGDRIVLFVPYYFNHLMAVQMTGGAADVVHGRCDPQTWHPDLDWLEQELARPNAPKMVVLVNPCNPTGEDPAIHTCAYASNPRMSVALVEHRMRQSSLVCYSRNLSNGVSGMQVYC